MKITNPNIQSLKQNQIFVFGSNLSGLHGGGAAWLAKEKFGAIWGQGVGLQGQCYGIPTKSKNIERTLTIEEIKPYVDVFIDFALKNQHQEFLVTEIGCGLAGHKIEDIAPLFKETLLMNNISLPEKFIIYLNK